MNLNLQEYYLLAITFCIILTCLIMVFMTIGNIIFDKNQKLRFIAIFALIALIAILDLTTTLIETSNSNDYLMIDYILNFLGFALSPLIPLLLSRALFAGRQNNIIYVLYLSYVVTLLVLIITNHIFTLDVTTNAYAREIGYYILYVPMLTICFIYLLTNTILIAKKMLSKNPVLLFVFFSAFICGTLVQVINQNVHINYLIITIVTTIFYDYVSSLWAQTDGLTGLLSQYSFINASKNLKDGDAIFMIDADDFKSVNDTYGHGQGDKTLIEHGKFIQNIFGRFGRCFRLGGDEFAVILSKQFNPDILMMRFKIRIKEKVNAKFPNLSIGYAIYRKGENFELFGQIADKNMYLDKAQNKHLNDKK